MKKFVIIGAGPIGLNLAIKLQEKGVDFLLLEANDHVGGQLIELYPKKEIVDIPGISSITAEKYIDLLDKKLNREFLKLNEHVIDISVNQNHCKVITKNSEFDCETIIICTGLGFYSPRKLGLKNEEQYNNIFYSVKDFSFLTNKKVVIFGGGDSALDWAKEISKISNEVSLVHRRDEFRGNAKTIENCKNLKIYLSYIPDSLIGENNSCRAINIKNIKNEEIIELKTDFIMVNFGTIPSPITFDVEKNGNFIKVDEKFATKAHVYAIGDVSIYENKVRRIAPGLDEINKLLTNLKI